MECPEGRRRLVRAERGRSFPDDDTREPVQVRNLEKEAFVIDNIRVTLSNGRQPTAYRQHWPPPNVSHARS